MKKLKNWITFNELNSETYRNAAKKLYRHHPSRAKELEKYADDVNSDIVDSGTVDSDTVNIVIYTPKYESDEEDVLVTKNVPLKDLHYMLVSTGEFVYYFPEAKHKQYRNSNYHQFIFADRKSALKFKRYIKNNDFYIDTAHKRLSRQQLDNIRKGVRFYIGEISINKLYSDKKLHKSPDILNTLSIWTDHYQEFMDYDISEFPPDKKGNYFYN
jgi:hypothetical protein